MVNLSEEQPNPTCTQSTCIQTKHGRLGDSPAESFERDKDVQHDIVWVGNVYTVFLMWKERKENGDGCGLQALGGEERTH